MHVIGSQKLGVTNNAGRDQRQMTDMSDTGDAGIYRQVYMFETGQ